MKAKSKTFWKKSSPQKARSSTKLWKQNVKCFGRNKAPKRLGAQQNHGSEK
jgi:hypothetical protein